MTDRVGSINTVEEKNTKMDPAVFEANKKKINDAIKGYLDKTTDIDTFKKNVSECITKAFTDAGEVPPPFEVEVQGIGLYVKFPDKDLMS